MNIGDIVTGEDFGEGMIAQVWGDHVEINVYWHPGTIMQDKDNVTVVECIHDSDGLCGDESCIRCVTLALFSER